MKKYLLVLILIFTSLCPIKALAEEGCITITLPGSLEVVPGNEMYFSYAKVGRMEKGKFVLQDEYVESDIDLNQLETAKELQDAAEELQSYVRQGGIVTMNEDGIVRIENLEEGVYLLNDYGDSQYEMIPTLLYIPTWEEDEKEMTYDITLEPKYHENLENPDTGDTSNGNIYFVFGLISLIIVMIVSCHNRFKYGRIPHKYSRKGRI